MDKKEYIERGALLKKSRRVTEYDEGGWGVVRSAILVEDVESAPTADVAPVVHGEWLRVSDDDQYEGEYYCSICNAEEFFPVNAPFAPFCWHCGAKMDGGSDGR